MSDLIAHISCVCGEFNCVVREGEGGMSVAGTAAWKMARHESQYHPNAKQTNPPTSVTYKYE